MTPQEFTYWLQGYMEVADPETIGEKETAMIKEHLALVFNKVTTTIKEDVPFCSPKEGTGTPFVPPPFEPYIPPAPNIQPWDTLPNQPWTTPYNPLDHVTCGPQAVSVTDGNMTLGEDGKFHFDVMSGESPPTICSNSLPDGLDFSAPCGVTEHSDLHSC
jgi:hypothetical protein